MSNMVYLAGPIANVSGINAVEWRYYCTHKLEGYKPEIRVRNPMRAKVSKLYNLKSISDNFHTYQDFGVFFKSRAIMTRDFNDVKQSTVLLVNLLGAKQPSLGTIMEMAWAFALQKPCVVAIEPEGNPHDNHPMIHEAMSFRVASLDEAIYAVVTILGVS